MVRLFFFFKQKTAYEMRISDWSSDVCSSDLLGGQGSVINPKFNAPDGPICADLREAGALLAASADYSHSYPHSWRSKAKVIYRCTPQWFVPMDKVIDHDTPRCAAEAEIRAHQGDGDRKSTRLTSSH